MNDFSSALKMVNASIKTLRLLDNAKKADRFSGLFFCFLCKRAKNGKLVANATNCGIMVCKEMMLPWHQRTPWI